MKILDLLIFYLEKFLINPFIIIPILLIVLVIRFNPENRKIANSIFIVFISSVLLLFPLTYIFEKLAYEEINDFFSNMDSTYSLKINGVVINKSYYLNDLKKISRVSAHRSHPTQPINIEVQSKNEKLLLKLSRDSEIKQEYWVFYPKYRTTSIGCSEIGRIQTPILDKY